MPHSVFESYDCSRCGGAGVYRPWGTCFLCNGAKYRYTKRGQAAYKFFKTLAYKPLGDFEVGETLLVEGFSAGSYVQPSFWAKVIRKDDDNITVENAKHGEQTYHKSCFATETRRALTAQEKADIFAQVRAYQDTLTKAGTVRKTKKTT